jgi:SpoVK/Ycf46/Vps4 family AAA+-type ATPase
MGKRDNKYGSPYDPNYTGKQMRPQDKKEQERREEERRQHQLRGCGDPSCSTCNPETAAMGARGGSMTGRRSDRGIMDEYTYLRGNDAERVLRFDDIRRLEDLVMRDFIRPFATGGTASAPKPKGPPGSYKKAREEVADYIVPAPEQAFDDIVGNDEALEQLRDAIQAPIKYKDLYAAYGMKMPKGALLSGPPGCGKTMFARAAAAEMKALYGKDVEFISISGSELQSMFVGETEGRIKAIFTFAREYKAHHGHPLLVFMDEAEVLLPDRTGRVRRVAPWEESQVATFLAEMDGMQESGAFMLLATNRPEVIDQAVLRDGRCDFKIVVKKPTAAAIELIIVKNFAGVPLGDDKLEALVFAAVESLFDPHRIILEAHAIGVDLKEHRFKDRGAKHFLLEHIVSGAMAASIPNRAKRYAFMRDKASGKVTGVNVSDVIKAVNDLFEENKGLDHSFALEEWKADVMAELNAND